MALSRSNLVWHCRYLVILHVFQVLLSPIRILLFGVARRVTGVARSDLYPSPRHFQASHGAVQCGHSDSSGIECLVTISSFETTCCQYRDVHIKYHSLTDKECGSQIWRKDLQFWTLGNTSVGHVDMSTMKIKATCHIPSLLILHSWISLVTGDVQHVVPPRVTSKARALKWPDLHRTNNLDWVETRWQPARRVSWFMGLSWLSLPSFFQDTFCNSFPSCTYTKQQS